MFAIIVGLEEYRDRWGELAILYQRLLQENNVTAMDIVGPECGGTEIDAMPEFTLRQLEVKIQASNVRLNCLTFAAEKSAPFFESLDRETKANNLVELNGYTFGFIESFEHELIKLLVMTAKLDDPEYLEEVVLPVVRGIELDSLDLEVPIAFFRETLSEHLELGRLNEIATNTCNERGLYK